MPLSRGFSASCCCLFPPPSKRAAFLVRCVCAAAHPCGRPQGNLRNHSCPPRFSNCPWGCPQARGPALGSTEATPTYCSLRIPTPTPSATGCVGWCFPRRPAALGPARGAGACFCGLPPTPSAPGAWPQPQRRFSSFSHPTCKYCRTSTPAPPSLVCLLCRSNQSVYLPSPRY